MAGLGDFASPDWAGDIPAPALGVLAMRHLSLTDISSASRVCKNWCSALRQYKRVVSLRPPQQANVRKTATELYPPHYFCLQDTVCFLSTSISRLGATEDEAQINTFSSLLSCYGLPALHVAYTSDELKAFRLYAKGIRAAAARAAAAAARAPARLTHNDPPVPRQDPQQRYYDLTQPLILFLTPILTSTHQPGQYLRRVTLQLSSMPAPTALHPLALLPSLDNFQLLGGSSAILEEAHLDALGSLTGLTSLALEGVWKMLRPSPPQPAVAMHEPGMGPVAAAVHGLVAPWHMGPGGAAAHAAGFPGAAAGHPAADAAQEPWPAAFCSLERLRVFHLRALPCCPLGHPRIAQKLRLDLYPLTGLQELAVHGCRFLDPGLSRLSSLQGLTRLVCDKDMSLKEWASIRALEGLQVVELRGDLPGQVGVPVINGRHVMALYGELNIEEARGQVSFPLPSKFGQGEGPTSTDGPGGSGGNGHQGVAGPVPGLENIITVQPAFDMFAAMSAGSGGGRGPSTREKQRKLRELAELHVRLEPLGFLADNTSLTQLKLSWQPDYKPYSDGEEDDGSVQQQPRRWNMDAALSARAGYVRCLAFLQELQDVELRCRGGELILDGSLLEGLAPAWRRLRRFVFSGLVLPSVVPALSLFPKLQEVGLHKVAGPCPGERPMDGLIVSTAKLPSGLERLALTGANVIHVPWVGVTGLQRLELRGACRWQTARATPEMTAAAPGTASGSPARSAVDNTVVAVDGAGPCSSGATAAAVAGRGRGRPPAGVGPWVFQGLSLLTHLHLQVSTAGPMQLKTVLRGCGGQLRALTLALPGDLVQATTILSGLRSDNAPLHNLVRLVLLVGERAKPLPYVVRPGDGGESDGEDDERFFGALGAHLGALPAEAVGHAPVVLPPPDMDSLMHRWGGVAQSLRPFVAELVAVVAAGHLPRLRQLWLQLPWFGLDQDREWQEHGQGTKRWCEMMADALEALGQLTELEEMRLAGPLVWAASGTVEKRLQAHLRSCNLHCQPRRVC